MRATQCLTLPVLALTLLLVAGCGAESDDPAGDPGAGAATAPNGKADSAGVAVPSWEEILQRCTPAPEDEPTLYSDDFRWDYTHKEMSDRFDAIYASGKRLPKRAHVEPESGELILPAMESWGARAGLSRRLVDNVRLHIERALALGYAEFIFFPDMGHAHLFIPEEHWEANYAGVAVARNAPDVMTPLFDDPELKVLYHTAEQLQMLDEENVLLDDRHIRWRFFTRNLVGDNQGLGRLELLHEPESKANTSRDYPGHHYRGAGFNVSASVDGCFPYVHDGEVRFFDLGLFDLEVSPEGRANMDYSEF